MIYICKDHLAALWEKSLYIAKQLRNQAGCYKGGLSEVGEKSNSRHILKVEWKVVAGKLDVCERECGE